MKLVLFKHNDVYSARLSNGVCLHISGKSFKAHAEADVIGQQLSPYPSAGWADPPLTVMRMFELAELVATSRGNDSA